MNRISKKNIANSDHKMVKDVWNAFMAEGAVFGNYDMRCLSSHICSSFSGVPRMYPVIRTILTDDSACRIFHSNQYIPLNHPQ